MLRIQSLLLMFALGCSAPATAQNLLDEAARALETANMQRLRAQQARPGVSISAFASDGCSGGMSQVWKTIASNWPGFARHIGDAPPWEYCCNAHDRDYWRGDTENGFVQRLQSDHELRACVERAGREQSVEIAERIGLTPEDIVEAIDLTAELMFHAVRVGGGPCTGLAWRWGHGWPPCDLEYEPGDEALTET